MLISTQIIYTDEAISNEIDLVLPLRFDHDRILHTYMV